MATAKRNLPYLISTGLLSAMMLLSVFMYVSQYEEVSKTFVSLGYPAYLVYPLAVAKVLGLVAIWSGVSPELRGLAYAGFFYDFVLATVGHLAAGDGQFAPAVVALVLLGISYFSGRSGAAA